MRHRHPVAAAPALALVTCRGRKLVKPRRIVATCADGVEKTYPVRITLGRVASGPDTGVFTRMTLAFPDDRPAAAETDTYPLDSARR